MRETLFQAKERSEDMLEPKMLEEIETYLHDMCGRGESEERDAGRVLLVSAFVGGDPAKVAAALGWEVSRVEPFAERLFRSGVWKYGKVHANWFDEENGGIEFGMDVGVAMGWMERSGAETYRQTPAGEAAGHTE